MLPRFTDIFFTLNMEMAKILEISALKVHYNTVSYPKATVIKATEYDDKQFVSCVI
jgi:hypothetical protein